MGDLLRRHLGWLLLISVIAGAATGLAYLRPTNAAVAVGEMEDRGYITGFHPREFSDFFKTSYRWGKPNSFLSLHGIGSRGRFRLELETYGGPQELLGRKVEVLVNGVPAGSFQTQAGWRTEAVEFGTGWWGDALVELRVSEGHAPGDSRPLGILLRSFQVRQVGDRLPALSQVAAGALLAGSVYLLLAFLGLSRAACGAAALLSGLALSLGLLGPRLATAAWSYGLVFSVLGAVLLVLLGWFIMSTQPLRQVGWGSVGVRRVLLAVVAFAFIIRLGGSTYPQTYVIDTRQHIEDVGKVLTGQLGEIWQPLASGLHNTNLAADLIIPYPPLYAIAVAPLAALPMPWPQGRALHFFSSLLDALAVLMIFMLARRAGLSQRAGLFGGIAYAIAPVMLLAVDWGVGPALFGSWAALLMLTLWSLLPPGRRSLLALSGACAFAWMGYAFNAVFLPVLALGVALVMFARSRQAVWRLALALLLGLCFDFAIYYWQYVGPVLESTLPGLAGVGGSHASIRPAPVDLRALFSLHAIEWPFPLAGAVLTGGALAFVPGVGRRAKVGKWATLFPALFLGGMLVFIVFTWMEVSVTFLMGHKQVWFAAPYLSLAAGEALSGWWDRGRVGRYFATLLVLALAVASFWYYRELILYANPQFP